MFTSSPVSPFFIKATKAVLSYWVELNSLRALIFDIKVSLLEMNQISFEDIWVLGKNSQGI